MPPTTAAAPAAPAARPVPPRPLVRSGAMASISMHWKDLGVADDDAWYESLPSIGLDRLQRGDILLKKIYHRHGSFAERSVEKMITSVGQKKLTPIISPVSRGMVGIGSWRSEHAALVLNPKGRMMAKIAEAVGEGIVVNYVQPATTYIVYRPRNELLRAWAAEVGELIANPRYQPEAHQPINLRSVDARATAIDHARINPAVAARARLAAAAAPRAPVAAAAAPVVRERRGAVTLHTMPMVNPRSANSYNMAGVFTSNFNGVGASADSTLAYLNRFHLMLHGLGGVGSLRPSVSMFCSEFVAACYMLSTLHLEQCRSTKVPSLGVNPAAMLPMALDAALYKERREFPLIGRVDTRSMSVDDVRKASHMD
jgi:hypothetical protein